VPAANKPGPKAAFSLEGAYPDPPDLSRYFTQFPQAKMFHVEQSKWWDSLKKVLVRERTAITDKLNELSNAVKK